jgi:hypothetical protein
VGELQFAPGLDRHLQVAINGVLVPRARWPYVRPKQGSVVTALPIPEGGEGMRLGLTLAIVAAATVASGGIAAAPILGGGLGASMLGAVVGATISTVGFMAVNALIPPAVPQMEAGREAVEAGETYSIEGARNTARLKGAVMQVLGEHRIYPSLAAPTYTEMDGDDQILNMLLDLGIGPVEVRDPRIGETGLDKFDDVDTEMSSGDWDEPQFVPQFPDDVVEDRVGRELLMSDSWMTLTTRPDTQRASLDIGFRQGIGFYNSAAKFTGTTVHFEVQYSPEGQNDWTELPEIQIEDKSSTPIRRTIKVQFPEIGQYDVRIARTSEDASKTDHLHHSHVEVLRSFRDDPPVNNRFCQLYGLKIRASRQTEGQIDTVNMIVTSICKDYKTSSESWEWSPTRNPASIMRHVLQNPANEMEVDDEFINFDDLEEWHTLCEQKKWMCDFVVDKDMSIWDLLGIVCGCGRARPMVVDGKWTVAVDYIKESDEFWITPKNSRGLVWEHNYVKIPDALRITFTDRDSDWKTREMDVFMDGKNKNNSERYEDWEMPGVTDNKAIWAHGRKRLAEILLRRESYEVTMDWEWLTFARGDRGRLAYDTILIGSGESYIKQVIVSGGLIVGIVLRDKIALDGTQRQMLRIRKADKESVSVICEAAIGEIDTFEPIEPPSTASGIAAGDLVIVGAPGVESMVVICNGITPASEFEATVSLIPYAEPIHYAEDSEIPEWDPLITDPAKLITVEIESIVSSESAMVRDSDGSYRLGMLVRLRQQGRSTRYRAIGIQLVVQEVTTGAADRYYELPSEATQANVPDVSMNETYIVRARYRLGPVKGGGKTPPFSAWSSAVPHTVGGPTRPPLGVETGWVEGDRVVWHMPVKPSDFAGYRLKYTLVENQEWEAAEDVSDNLYPVNYILIDEVPQNAYEILIKSETTSEKQSLLPARIRVIGIDRPDLYQVYKEDFGALGFPGTKTNYVVADGELKSTDTSLWGSSKTSKWGSPKTGLWADVVWSNWTWEFEYICPSNILSTDRIMLNMLHRGEVRVEFRWINDIVSEYPDEDPVPAADDYTIPPDWVAFGGLATGATARPFKPWKNGLRPVANEPIQFRVTGIGGQAARPALSRFIMEVQGVELKEILSDELIATSGKVLKLTKGFRTIRYVLGTIQRPSNAITFGHTAKSVTGTRVELIDKEGNLVSGVADITVGGT